MQASSGKVGVETISSPQRDIVTVPVENSKARRDRKVRELKAQYSAASIQARWRGIQARKNTKKVGPFVAAVSPAQQKGGVGKSGVNIGARGPALSLNVDLPESKNADSPVINQRKVGGSENPVRRDNNDDIDSQAEDEGEDDIDEEESVAATAANRAEQAVLEQEPFVHVWPSPLVDNFDGDWPDLSMGRTDDQAVQDKRVHDIEQWVHEKKKVHIRVVTWNLCARNPPAMEETRKLLFPLNKFHVYVIGSEECERSIAMSALRTSKRTWEDYLQEALGSLYVPLQVQILQAIHIIVFAHVGIAHLCSELVSAAVPTGIGNTLGNKGGVGISMRIGNTSFVVVNAHLAAHQNGVKQRNADYNRIAKGMPQLLMKKTQKFANLRTSPKAVDFNSSPSSSAPSPLNDGITTGGGGAAEVGKSGGLPSSAEGGNVRNSGTYDPKNAVPFDKCADRIIFMGDLNYRVRGNNQVVRELLKSNMHDVMLNNDQLKWSQKQMLALSTFTEPPLNFRPTYKLEFESDEYDLGKKKRVPAWTDRILYVARPGLECTAYNAEFSLRSSDHRPVYASFEVAVDTESHTSPDGIAAEAHRTAAGEGAEGACARFEKNRPKFQSESQVCTIA